MPADDVRVDHINSELPSKETQQVIQTIPSVSPQAHTVTHEVSPEIDNDESKVLYITDSVGEIVSLSAFSYATGAKIVKVATANSDNSELLDITKSELEKTAFNTVVLHVGSDDISRFDTMNDPAQQLEYFEQEVIKTATGVLNVAEQVLSDYSSVQKLVVIKHPPRFESKASDPYNIKKDLTTLYNSTLEHRRF